MKYTITVWTEIFLCIMQCNKNKIAMFNWTLKVISSQVIILRQSALNSHLSMAWALYT